MLTSYGWVGGPCDFCVTPSPFGLDFGTSDSGLTIDNLPVYLFLSISHCIGSLKSFCYA